MSLRIRTAKGIIWVTISQLTRLVVNFGMVAVLARLLKPSDFGLMAMVAVFSNMFILLNDLGLSSAIIQKQDVTEEGVSSAFWANIIEGFIVSAVFFALAPLIARFYSRSVLTPMIMVLSAVFTISSLGMIQYALISKRMDFRKLAIIEMASAVAGGATAIVFAASGFGVWSLVANSLASCIVMTFLLIILTGWWPKLILRWQPLKDLLSYGLHLLGFRLVNYFSRNLDNIIIGRFLGARQLGFYDVAYRMMLFPLGNVSWMLGRVMFPALSLIQDDKESVRSAYSRVTLYIGAVTFPLMAGVAVLAPQLIRVVLGPRWGRSVFLIQVLALVGLVQSISTTLPWIFQSQGKTKALFRYGLWVAAIYACAFLVGVQWNVEGVAVAYAIAVLVALYPGFAIAFKYIDMRFSHFARQFLTVALATAGMAVLTLGVSQLVGTVLGLGDLPVLIVGAVAGAASYLGILMLIDRKLVKGMVDIARDLRSREKPVPLQLPE